ncbi:hypothetical protein FLGSB24_36760 [Flavobacterium sp. GSB-24]|nr:hypothetical protein FLGSB24_36760 [Flavobacterium sp. GSB-24]
MGYISYGQVGIGTVSPNPSSQLDIVSENKGILIPRVSLTGITDSKTIANGNINGLLVFNTGTTEDTQPGFYYWYADKWIRIGSASAQDLTNSLTYANNNITSVVNGQAATAQIVNSVSNSLNGTNLITTVNGFSGSAVDLAPLLSDDVAADNGLTANDAKIELGGALTKPTVITATASNSLSLAGLQTGSNTYVYDGESYSSVSDRILVGDPVSGLIKQVKSAMPNFFYAPSVAVPTHNQSGALLSGPQTLDVYSLYARQFGYHQGSGQARSNNASVLPVLAPADLDYFVTYFDSTVFDSVSISASGVITYSIKAGAAISENSFMNIVFKVKD